MSIIGRRQRLRAAATASDTDTATREAAGVVAVGGRQQLQWFGLRRQSCGVAAVLAFDFVGFYLFREREGG